MVNVDTLTVHHRIFKITASTVIRQRILILVLGRLWTIFNELPSEEVECRCRSELEKQLYSILCSIIGRNDQGFHFHIYLLKTAEKPDTLREFR